MLYSHTQHKDQMKLERMIRMKQKIIGLLMLAGMIALAGCAGKNTPVQTSGKTVEPLPGTLDVETLDNCTFAAGFEASDVYLSDDGMLGVHMTVYDYERFDLVDISELTAGDTLVIDGNRMPVESIERDENGFVTINGGLEEGGCYLATDDSGVFYEILTDDAKSYYAIGETTLPIGQEFIFLDDSDLENPGQISYAGDFLMAMEKSDRSFSPYATTVTVQDEFITNLTQIYVP